MQIHRPPQSPAKLVDEVSSGLRSADVNGELLRPRLEIIGCHGDEASTRRANQQSAPIRPIHQ
jgi:hypothetical protein